MITPDSGSWMGARRFSSPHRGVGVLAMPDARLDTMRRVESVGMVRLGAGELQLLLPCMPDGVIIDRRCVADGVQGRH
jgi:hypothetical protein